MTHLKADPKALDEQAEDFGYTAFGPLILAFSAWLEEEAEKRGIHRLYFLSREGYFLLQLYKEALRLGLCRLSNIDARYLYISRRATFGAAEKTPETLDLMLRSGQFQGPLYDLLDARLGLSRDFCEDHGLPNVTVDVENDSKAVLDLLKPILPALQKKTASERAPLEQYLRQEGFFDDQLVGLVDVGYSASIQRWLWMLTKRDLTGFYFATTDAVNEWQNPHNLVLGCFATECSLTKMPPVYRYALASESWLTAPTGQVLQFKMEGEDRKSVV